MCADISARLVRGRCMLRSSYCAIAALVLAAGCATEKAETSQTAQPVVAQPAAPAPVAAPAAPAAPVSAKKPAARSQVTEGAFTLDIVDYSPQFLDWFEAAQTTPNADA